MEKKLVGRQTCYPCYTYSTLYERYLPMACIPKWVVGIASSISHSHTAEGNQTEFLESSKIPLLFTLPIAFV